MSVAESPVLSLAEQQEKLRDEEIWGFECQECQHQQFGPMIRCPACASRKIGKKQFASTGTIVSYTIQTVAAEQFLNETPFAFAVIQLDDGPRLSGWVPWISKPSELPLGSKVGFVSSYKPGMMFEPVGS